MQELLFHISFSTESPPVEDPAFIRLLQVGSYPSVAGI